MIRTCPHCGGRVLSTTMTPAEEARFAAAFRCVACARRLLEEWPPAPPPRHRPIDEH